MLGSEESRITRQLVHCNVKQVRTVNPNLEDSLVYNHKIQRNGSLATGISILVMTIEEELGSNEERLGKS